MPDTPRGYPVPSGTDRPDVVRDMTALAEAIDTDVSAIRVPMTRNGIASIPASATFSNTVAITYSGDPFSPGVPLVVATIAGNPTRRIVRVDSVSATGAVLSVHTTDGSALGNATTVYWLAQARS